MATDNIKSILDKLENDSEKDAYIAAQFETISKLNKKLINSEEKIKHLEELLSKTTPLISVSSSKNREDEENICRVEISKLRDISIQRPLTLEEARKLETYHKVLNNLRNQPKEKSDEAKNASDADLLSLVNENNE